MLTNSVVGLFLKNFDLVKILLLREMGRGILEIFTCLSLDILLGVYLFEVDLLNCTNIYCLKDLLSLFAVNLSQLNSYIAERKSHTARPNSET